VRNASRSSELLSWLPRSRRAGSVIADQLKISSIVEVEAEHHDEVARALHRQFCSSPSSRRG
jgi:hypothetical protein